MTEADVRRMASLNYAEDNYVAAYARWQSQKWLNDDKPSLKWRIIDGPRLWKAFQVAADVLDQVRKQ